ncbi:MBL fold metallo-hydrolase [Acuticoccus sp.]|uniref:MBL fold metallo-hydrolase n=1 Tax=Acuticoccus sp. TaxID=1904378 RepID=UPI003B517517
MLTKTSPSTGLGSPDVTGFYEPASGSIQYVVTCPTTRQAALVDVVMGFDPDAARLDPAPTEAVCNYVEAEGLSVALILDTHPHADHLMAQALLKERYGAPTGIGAKVAEIAALWREIYHMPDAFEAMRDFDHLFEDGDTFRIGDLDGRVMLSPGHTLASVTYVIGDAAFVHDTVMQPDFGTARADFPGGDAATLYDSVAAILALPDATRLFVGHDYGTEERDEPCWESTVAEQKASNVHLVGCATKADFVALREARDAGLGLPRRMLAALQVNLCGGRLPHPEADGKRYLKIPLNRF